mmetsp:Transcript_131881/g.328847  ORF Transcript_131881/g.328847 Transcript_131881/m.328847 type:complete len:226 (+) Transcript_131881:274-951(+)
MIWANSNSTVSIFSLACRRCRVTSSTVSSIPAPPSSPLLSLMPSALAEIPAEPKLMSSPNGARDDSGAEAKGVAATSPAWGGCGCHCTFGCCCCCRGPAREEGLDKAMPCKSTSSMLPPLPLQPLKPLEPKAPKEAEWGWVPGAGHGSPNAAICVVASSGHAPVPAPEPSMECFWAGRTSLAGAVELAEGEAPLPSAAAGGKSAPARSAAHPELPPAEPPPEATM